MDSASFNQEENSMKKAHTLVRRVSDLFRDGSCSGPPSLFSQKIRHCCENLNLYVLYTIGRTESHPLAKKVNLCLELLMQNLFQRVFFLCTSLRRALLYSFQQKSLVSLSNEVKQGGLPPTQQRQRQLSSSSSCSSNFSLSSDEESESRRTKFLRLQRQKPKQISPLLLAAVYLAPVAITLQLIWVSSFLFYGEYTPGFVFLLSALFLLGYILTKIMFQEPEASAKPKGQERREKSRQKRKE